MDALTPSLWRTTFNNPSINLIDVRMIAELREFVRIERDEWPAVLIVESADPSYLLARFDKLTKIYRSILDRHFA